MKKRLLSAIIALLFVSAQLFAALPASALPQCEPRFDTPAGYDENDYQKLVAFMETTDANGVRNGEKVVAPFNGYYIPTYPDSWSYYYYDHEEGALYMWGVFWSEEDVRRVGSLWLYGMDLVGSLDFSDCIEMSEVYCDWNHISALNASGCAYMRALLCSHNDMKRIDIKGCTTLELFDCSSNSLSELDASGCTAMYDIECNDNSLTSLDVTGCTNLGWLDCFNNSLTELDLSDCRALYYLDCTNNPLKEIKVSSYSQLAVEQISAVGGGSVSYSGSTYGTETAYASPDANAEFLGWYSEDGQLISSSLDINVRTCGHTKVQARFTSDFIVGDVDGNGSVTAADALLALRYSLGLVDEIDLSAADVDGSGAVTASDALLILRYTLGLAEL